MPPIRPEMTLRELADLIKNGQTPEPPPMEKIEPKTAPKEEPKVEPKTKDEPTKKQASDRAPMMAVASSGEVGKQIWVKTSDSRPGDLLIVYGPDKKLFSWRSVGSELYEVVVAIPDRPGTYEVVMTDAANVELLRSTYTATEPGVVETKKASVTPLDWAEILSGVQRIGTRIEAIERDAEDLRKSLPMKP